MKLRFLLPAILFLVLVGFLAAGLQRDPREVPSPLVGKPAPTFSLPQLGNMQKTFTPADLRGKVWLLNVFASWCVTCRDEHPLLMDMAKNNTITLIGLNYKDKNEDAQTFLQRLGNPYHLVAFDEAGRVGIDYGVYGVPETYLIDKKGVIRHKQIGAITSHGLNNTLLPLINTLLAEP